MKYLACLFLVACGSHGASPASVAAPTSQPAPLTAEVAAGIWLLNSPSCGVESGISNYNEIFTVNTDGSWSLDRSWTYQNASNQNETGTSSNSGLAGTVQLAGTISGTIWSYPISSGCTWTFDRQ